MADNVQHVNHDNQQNYVTRLFVPFGLSSHVNNQTEFIIFTSWTENELTTGSLLSTYILKCFPIH
jgi:hypothetical protein